MENRKVAERCVQLYVTRFKRIRPPHSWRPFFQTIISFFFLAPPKNIEQQSWKNGFPPKFWLHFYFFDERAMLECWQQTHFVCAREQSRALLIFCVYFSSPFFGLRRRDAKRIPREKRRGRYTHNSLDDGWPYSIRGKRKKDKREKSIFG